jgi:hypothetical protein
MFGSQYSAFTSIPAQKSNATDNTTVNNIVPDDTSINCIATDDAITDNMLMENNIHTPTKIIEQNDFPKPQEINRDNAQDITNHIGNNTTNRAATHTTTAEPERWCICEYICCCFTTIYDD